MSGSGSTTFALFSNQSAADKASKAFIAEMGDAHWTQVVDLN
jgi:4-diphosphocytidyl-2C-methyl-D-erythritol kinase